MRLLAVLAAALALDLIFPLPPTVPNVDSALYQTLARNLAAGRGFVAPDRIALSVPDATVRPIVPSAIRTPGYPLFLALVPAPVLVQRALHVLLAGAVYLLVAAVTRRPRLAMISGLILALHLPSIAIAREVMTETLFAVVVFGVFAALALKKEWAGVLLVSIAPLIRPIAVFLPLTIAVWKRKWLPALAFLLIGYLPSALWIARNVLVAGAPVLDCITGENALFFRGAAVRVAATKGPFFGLTALQRQTGFYRELVRSRPALLAEALEGTTAKTHAQRSVVYGRAGGRILRQHPIVFAELMVSGFVRLWFDAPWETAQAAGFDYRDARILLLPLAVVAFVFGIVGFFALREIDKRFAGLTLLFVVYFTILSSGPDAEPRFTTPYAPMLAILIAAGIERVYGIRSDQNSIRRGSEGDQSGRGAESSS
ncbi:MAG TPA: hypothetical protein VJ276_17490 [Thermoanaerobaculia bacterium]|nr:hypothetical protein [Thermoanaerobaculia bacterium]